MMALRGCSAGEPCRYRVIPVRYRAEQGVREELDALTAAERQCCSFADWEVTQEGEHVVLRIASDTDGIAALAELFGAA